ncbi:zinc finger protein 236-like [Sabethes cyaneus]|uniref:zinc finger protein 236-like n=1 Tax=Sabethes cyaneus TaxID=53552 RepID=UPI00237EE51A|nr:zinc finger protein 236-like [Sabethes cyaneus]
MESTGSKTASIEQIKVEPDFYFPIGENYGQEGEAEAIDDNDDDYDDDDDDFDNEEELQMQQQIGLDSSAKQKLVEDTFIVISDGTDDSSKGKLYECKVCKKRMSNSGHLMRHRRIHSGERPFVCHVCDKAFIESTSLKVHLRTHTGERPYRCEICTFTSAQSCNLQSHYRRTHGIDPKSNPQQFDKLRRQSSVDSSSGSVISQSSASWVDPKAQSQTKPCHCCVCEEPFFDRDLLLIHEETHVPEAPFECRYCNSVHSALSLFRSHISMHHINQRKASAANHARQSQAGIRAIPSALVATRKVDPTSDPSNINTVLNANQPFIASNDSQYPYKCVECNENFQKHQLYYHMKIHLKQTNIFTKKSIQCDQCDKVFEKELTLKKHMDAAHPTVSSASHDNPLLLEALQTEARSLTPSPSTVMMVTSEVDSSSIDVKVKEEAQSGLGDDEVNSTVSDNPILTQLLNTSSEVAVNEPINAAPAGDGINSEISSDGGFIISAVATVDHSFLEQLDAMERQQQQSDESQVQPMPALRRMPVLEESLRRPPVTPVSNNIASIRPMPLSSGCYRCSFCSKQFNEHFGLRQHIRAMHYSEKRHKCPECGKKFTLGITLATHLRIHTAVQPFTCIVCYKTFTRSSSLNGHLSSHSYSRIKCAECGTHQVNVLQYMKHIEKFHPDFMQNVACYREKAEAILQRRRELVLQITRGLSKYRSEVPNVLARLRGELPGSTSEMNLQNVTQSHEEDEVSSSEQVLIKQERADSSQSGIVSSASESVESLPALRAELRKRPLRSNTRSNELEELALPPARKSTRSAAATSPNLKRLLEQDSSNMSTETE